MSRNSIIFWLGVALVIFGAGMLLGCQGQLPTFITALIIVLIGLVTAEVMIMVEKWNRRDTIRRDTINRDINKYTDGGLKWK